MERRKENGKGNGREEGKFYLGALLNYRYHSGHFTYSVSLRPRIVRSSVHWKRKRGSQKLICLTGKMAELRLKSSFLNKIFFFFYYLSLSKKIFSSVFGSSVTYEYNQRDHSKALFPQLVVHLSLSARPRTLPLQGPTQHFKEILFFIPLAWHQQWYATMMGWIVFLWKMLKSSAIVPYLKIGCLQIFELR